MLLCVCLPDLQSLCQPAPGNTPYQTRCDELSPGALAGLSRRRVKHPTEQVRPDAGDDEEDGQVLEDDGPHGRRFAGDAAEVERFYS